MKLIIRIAFICFLTTNIFAQSSVTLSIDLNKTGREIPPDFSGESFETSSIRLNNGGLKGYLFDSTDTQLITIFKNLGLKSLRIGGGTVDFAPKVPTFADIDALFRFANSAGVKVIYSLRLINGNAEENASIAKYIWTNYKSLLDCFAIGNEPDWHSYHRADPEIYETTPGEPGTAFPSYISKWKRFAKAILDSVPNAKLSGPNTGSNFPVPFAKYTGFNGKNWTVNFLDEEKNSGIIKFIAQHNYVGQSTNGKTVQEVIDEMLSPVWDSVYYPDLYNANCVPALKAGIPFRLTESNCFSEGIDGGSNSFATALFALDYLHWWSVNNAEGINFHSTQWRYNATIRHDESGNIFINPMGYGIAAFNLGGHGNVEPLSISNPDTLNLTAYAVKDANYLFVTIINKEHGQKERQANVIIKSTDSMHKAYVMFLIAPGNNVSAKTGITLGGSIISNDEKWEGKWMTLNSTDVSNYKIEVPAASAAIVKISIQ